LLFIGSQAKILNILAVVDLAWRLNSLHEKILVPLDGSELAQIALPYAEKLAGKLGYQITLIYVSGSIDDQYHHMHQFYLQKMAETARQAAEIHVENLEVKAIKVETAILLGDPAEQIVDYADKEGVGLIIMSTHGRSGIKRWAMGSVADKVLRATKQPLALIRAKRARPDAPERNILSKILVTLDGSKQSEAVIPYIEELASKLKADITLLQVVLPDYNLSTTGEPEYGVYSEKHLESIQALAREYLENIAAQLKQRGINAKPEVALGTAAETIIKFADAIAADMVALSTHGRSGVSRWALGSVAERVLRAGDTPLLLVRTPGSGTE
jgi:nucleotide-binding universal stress UspA family protein